MTSGERVVDVSVWGYTTTREDPDNHEITILNSTGRKLTVWIVAHKFKVGHHPSLHPPHVHIM